MSKEGKIKATTGFQAGNIPLDELEVLFKERILSTNKTIEFVNKSLRSALSIIKEGGHVTMVHSDKKYRLVYDNRRVIIESKTPSGEPFLFDSKPVPSVGYCNNLRSLAKLPRSVVYNQYSSTIRVNKYKNHTDLAIRSFLKGLLSHPPRFGLVNDFENYTEIVNFIKKFDPSVRISKSSISNLKNRAVFIKSVPINTRTLEFVEYVKTRFPAFEPYNYFEKSGK